MDDMRKSLMHTGVFRTPKDAVQYLIMKRIGETPSPVGAFALKERLSEMGIETGTATIGRVLKVLDESGYTETVSNQGRILTDRGRARLQKLEESLKRADMVNTTSQAMIVNKYSDLLDLMEARKAIEVEATRLAAIHATTKDILQMKEAVLQYYRCVSQKTQIIDTALDFHALVAEASKNKYIKNMFDMLSFEEKQIEETMDVLLTREKGPEYVVVHDQIEQAIEKHDPELAVQLMEEHLKSIKNTVREQISLMEEEGAAKSF